LTPSQTFLSDTAAANNIHHIPDYLHSPLDQKFLQWMQHSGKCSDTDLCDETNIFCFFVTVRLLGMFYDLHIRQSSSDSVYSLSQGDLPRRSLCFHVYWWNNDGHRCESFENYKLLKQTTYEVFSRW